MNEPRAPIVARRLRHKAQHAEALTKRRGLIGAGWILLRSSGHEKGEALLCKANKLRRFHSNS